MLIEQKRFIDNLKYYRKRNNYSQQKLAELCDVSNGTIGNIETGVTKPSFDLIIKLSNVLNITPDKLFVESNDTVFLFSDKQLDYLYAELKNELMKSLNDSINSSLLIILEKMQRN